MFGISIIIVNYKSHQLICECIKSIKNFGINCDHEIIIVNNDTSERGENIIRDLYPKVIWCEMGYNAGFARANNRGILLSRYNYILLLNPDTIILNDAINKSFIQFANSDYIACGVQLLNSDYTNQISGGKLFVAGLNYLLPIPYFGYFLKTFASFLNINPTHVKKASMLSEVDWINGAFIMARKESILKSCLLDEEFFLYAEEIEWCFRLSKIGKLVIWGNCQVVHFVSGTIQTVTKSSDNSYSNLFDKKGSQLLVSNQLMILKIYGSIMFFMHLLIHTIGSLLNILFIPIEYLLLRRGISVILNKSLFYFRNVLRIWMLLPQYLSHKPHFFKVI
jgi:GT2 family glycosyltransferase